MRNHYTKVARKYARALFEGAELGIEDIDRASSIASTLESLSSAWTESRELQASMLNPAIPLEIRKKALQEIVQKMGSEAKPLSGLLSVLLENGSLSALPAIAIAFRKKIDHLSGLTELSITSAFPISDGEKKDFLSRIEQSLGAMPRIHWEVNPDLIGGLRISCGDRVYDGSIQNSIHQLRNTLLS